LILQTCLILTLKTAYVQLQDAAKSLFSRYVVFKEIDQITGKQSVLEARWVSAVQYIAGAGLIRIQFSGVVVPLVTRLETNFTSYAISSISKMTSTYAIRLYELLLQWGSMGHREVEIDWLKSALQVASDYSRLSNFKRNGWLMLLYLKLTTIRGLGSNGTGNALKEMSSYLKCHHQYNVAAATFHWRPHREW
jgi:plasmid replication initiation protein